MMFVGRHVTSGSVTGILGASMGACRNSFFGVFGIFLAKKSFQSSKFSEGIFFTWPLFSHFVKGAG
jgi:hypothetical protein